MKKKLLIVLSASFLAVTLLTALLLLGSVSDFKSEQSLPIESFSYHELSQQNYPLWLDCVGFVGTCDIPEMGLHFELTFRGISPKRPFPNFLNMTGWGDHKGWSLNTVYFGIRQLTVPVPVPVPGQDKNFVFTQRYWNSGGYVSFDHLITINSDEQKLYISSSNVGFLAENENGWVINW